MKRATTQEMTNGEQVLSEKREKYSCHHASSHSANKKQKTDASQIYSGDVLCEEQSAHHLPDQHDSACEIQPSECNRSLRDKIIVSEIYIYPIKSCGGIQVNSVNIRKRGLQYDRIFAVVNKKLNLISIRCHPKMAAVKTTLSGDEEYLIISAPNMPRLTIPIHQKHSSTATKDLQSITIWDDVIDAYEVSDVASQWFSTYLKSKDVKLMRMAEHHKRVINPEFSTDGQLSLADEFPIMMTSVRSLDVLNQRLVEEVTLANFRPNIVVSGCGAFAEDQWRSVTIGGVVLSVAQPCSRCSLPNVNPITGIRDNLLSVTKALREFRTGRHLGLQREDWAEKVFFGVQLDHHSGQWDDEEGCMVRVGDEVLVEDL